MQRTHFDQMRCPIAQSLERIGEWWSILIVRDAFRGLTKFDEFRQSLGVSPTMLARRLDTLVSNGILCKQPYQTRPVRHEYLLTARGEELFPVLLSLLSWGNAFLDGDPTVVPVHRRTGRPVAPQLIDKHTGRPLNFHNVRVTGGAGTAPGEKPASGPVSPYTDVSKQEKK
ncbi:winged helix-turn-helix transcriptional regulator [Martelella alba]|uniref:Helix-turn-helix transcriptional regulator n=1 Tax=Martelella alba TaxID=2590451 RepID=A0ABY2SLF6_9HYPH|nr:helix-turn-helix domain-containing protein [Martelella alba]TKI06543.1 helix-turn-helix transcriptional regulator [Martelella alba]